MADASAAAETATHDSTISVISNPYTDTAAIEVQAVVSTATITGLVPSDTSGDVYYQVGSSLIKDTTASKGAATWAEVTVKLKAVLKTSTGEVDTLGKAFASLPAADLAKQFYVSVATTGTHVKISTTKWGDGTSVDSSSNKKTLAQIGLTASTAGTELTLDTAVLTFYVGIYGGTSTSNDGFDNSADATGYKITTSVTC